MSAQTDTTQSVVVYFRMANDDLGSVQTLGTQLSAAIDRAQAGAYDGHEVALLDGDDAYLFMVGPDAERLFDVVRPLLDASSLMRGARVTLRQGPPEDDDVPERIVMLSG